MSHSYWWLRAAYVTVLCVFVGTAVNISTPVHVPMSWMTTTALLVVLILERTDKKEID